MGESDRNLCEITETASGLLRVNRVCDRRSRRSVDRNAGERNNRGSHSQGSGEISLPEE